MQEEILISSCCEAVMVQENWCSCCDRPCKPKKELMKQNKQEKIIRDFKNNFVDSEDGRAYWLFKKIGDNQLGIARQKDVVEWLEKNIPKLLSQTRQEAVEEERERIKGAFIEHFAGAGEIFFPYVGVGDTDLDEEITAAHQEWNEIIKALSSKEEK